MMRIIIPGTLPGLNEYVHANRTDPRAGSRMSRDAHVICKLGMLRHAGHRVKQAYILFKWYEKNRRRDKDNIAFAKKFILDSLQEMGILKNDGWEEVLGFLDVFEVDKRQPRVEVYLFSADEADKWKGMAL
nr:MAG TPA: crossover junction endodeoxyribonuclease [Caudoviricetes sp.]